MYDLIEVKGNDVFTNSKVVAEGTNNQHKAIQQLIQKYENEIYEDSKVEFKMVASQSGQKEKIYLLNEEQATFAITLLRNNTVVVKFKKNLVKQFYTMRRHLIEIQSKSWIDTRENSKVNRLKETDVIKQLVQYAEEQGSTHSNKLYINYSKLAKKVINCDRDDANITQLNNLTLIESIILQTIRIDMSIGMHYKAIYRDCKDRIEKFSEITYMNITDKALAN